MVNTKKDKRKTISMKVFARENEILKNAGIIVGIPKTAFIRMIAIKEARKIIQENKLEAPTA